GVIVMCQMEVPIEQIEKLLLRAHLAGASTVLNLAPPRPLTSLSVLQAIDFLIVNEGELVSLSKQIDIDTTQPKADLLRSVAMQTATTIIVTLGAAGAAAFHEGQEYRIAAPKVEPIDTVGAGDAFAGAFAAALDRGAEFEEALQHGVVAGSLACTQQGAQSALPTLQAIQQMIAC
ncbi:MAG: PfkB family carbohydrate kinase, partial [Myxococcota bacterium]